MIRGDILDKRDPAIVVNADVKDSELRIPDGVVKNVSFHGEFNNHVARDKPNGDPNSAVTLSGFTGAYGSIPFQIPRVTLAEPLEAGRERNVPDRVPPAPAQRADRRAAHSVLGRSGQGEPGISGGPRRAEAPPAALPGRDRRQPGRSALQTQEPPAENGRRSRVHGPGAVDPERQVRERRQHAPDRRRSRKLLQPVLRRAREDGRRPERAEPFSEREDVPRNGDQQRRARFLSTARRRRGRRASFAR